jgi:hypothetical protein
MPSQLALKRAAQHRGQQRRQLRRLNLVKFVQYSLDKWCIHTLCFHT